MQKLVCVILLRTRQLLLEPQHLTLTRPRRKTQLDHSRPAWRCRPTAAFTYTIKQDLMNNAVCNKGEPNSYFRNGYFELANYLLGPLCRRPTGLFSKC